MGHIRQVSFVEAPRVVEKVPGGQLIHTRDEFAPMVVEYVPGSQGEQDVCEIAPYTGEKVPGGQN